MPRIVVRRTQFQSLLSHDEKRRLITLAKASSQSCSVVVRELIRKEYRALLAQEARDKRLRSTQ